MENNSCTPKIINYDGKEYICSLAFALRLIGDKYKSLILFHLKDGEMRSGELQKSIAGLSNRMFTFSVRALENDLLVSREVYPEVPPHVVYKLTESGKAIIPIILELDEWGKAFAKDHHLYAPCE
ncbi:winged helix-turn-helix transcriptional regulator [Labilibaculum antarcticum]|jgi:DNA-binding HxlR family transcriptional regulator|uniref:Transcriptional regulator n=1 Tax=Labilibaculum antarcticum TaxID=1717717 RepID=A0A1Y1CQ35_9BACT|nr:helix-turn-helix domain-containing protein [Labilibaculum antarcticum]BAX82052.1 transcriptional regulator [Labilibaculum antarcticum]